jgi:DNA-binding NtrC family response regulator
LFGHERGAFTDAKATKKGLLELADGGTLLLDEIGDLKPAIQAKLLRVLETRTFRRVGGNQDISVDVRVIASTNKNIADAVDRGEFRQDLLYRLKVIGVRMPSIAERKDDIPVLAGHFLQSFAREFNQPLKQLAPETIDVLRQYDWPGNVRELRNAVERLVVLARSDKLTLRDVPANIRGGADLTRIAVVRTGMTVEEAEKQLIIQALKETGGNRTAAARKIGISRRTLHRKLKQFQLEEL